MRARLHRIAAALITGAGVLSVAGGCSGDGSPPAIVDTLDLEFSDAAPGLAPWLPPLLDVHAPEAADAAPMAVIVPPHGVPRVEAVAITQLARALAEAGIVAVVADWSQTEEPDDETTDPDIAEAMGAAGQSVVACAVSFAIEHAADFGADPERVVVVGQLYGGNAAGVVTLAGSQPIAGCAATATPAVRALVALDADWIAAMPAWDGLGEDAWRAVEALTPWGVGDPQVGVTVSAVVSAEAPAASARCGGRDAEWLAQRDPTGEIRAALDAVGAFEDGCVDFADSARASVHALDAVGIAATSTALANDDGETVDSGGTFVLEFGASDLGELVEIVRSSVR